MATYRTRQGDTWDSIAHNELGDVALTDRLMWLNGKYLEYYTFPAGIVLELPDVQAAPEYADATPWKQVSG